MNAMQVIFLVATLLGAVGMWLLLPGRGPQARMLGVLVGMASLGLFGSQVPSLGGWGLDGLFWILAGVTVVSAAGTVTFRNPVYCALWFALSLLGTAALLMFQGSQFLSVATVVVYAGAILVTFLFVLMLAQPKGQANYDRVSWEGLLSATAGAVLVGVLTMTLAGMFRPVDQVAVLVPPATAELEQEILATNHVARLGARLFGRHLVAIEVAGTLLLIGLVGAVAIAAEHKRKPERPSTAGSPPLEDVALPAADVRPLVKEAVRGNVATPEKIGTRA